METSSRPEALDSDVVDVVDLALLQVVVPVLIMFPHGADLAAFNTQTSDITDQPQCCFSSVSSSQKQQNCFSLPHSQSRSENVLSRVTRPSDLMYAANSSSFALL